MALGRIEKKAVACGACEGTGEVERIFYISSCCNCTVATAMGDSWCSCCMEPIEWE